MANITLIGQIDGFDVHEVSISCASGLCARILTYGARLAELWVPDARGALADVVLGHESLSDWQTHGTYVGAICGRFANRIAGGRFELDGQTHQLDRNEGDNTLHGGSRGFDRHIWRVVQTSATEVTLATTSPHGEMGFPGTVEARVTYRMGAAGLDIVMQAETDRPTVVNMVNHAYFNLAGQGNGDVMGHVLRIDAGHYLPVDDGLIPTGEMRPVAGTAFDFRERRTIGAALPNASGFDHNFCLAAPLDAKGMRPCLVVVDPGSGRRMRIATSEPGVQLYTGAHFNGGPGKQGARYPRFAGFAAETQRFPDSPNRPQFASARLNPGETYRHVMRIDFDTLGHDHNGAMSARQ